MSKRDVQWLNLFACCLFVCLFVFKNIFQQFVLPGILIFTCIQIRYLESPI